MSTFATNAELVKARAAELRENKEAMSAARETSSYKNATPEEQLAIIKSALDAVRVARAARAEAVEEEAVEEEALGVGVPKIKPNKKGHNVFFSPEKEGTLKEEEQGETEEQTTIPAETVSPELTVEEESARLVAASVTPELTVEEEEAARLAAEAARRRIIDEEKEMLVDILVNNKQTHIVKYDIQKNTWNMEPISFRYEQSRTNEMVNQLVEGLDNESITMNLYLCEQYLDFQNRFRKLSNKEKTKIINKKKFTITLSEPPIKRYFLNYLLKNKKGGRKTIRKKNSRKRKTKKHRKSFRYKRVKQSK